MLPGCVPACTAVSDRAAAQCRRCPCEIGAAVVQQPFDGMRRLRCAEAAFDGGDLKITHHLAGDARIGDGGPGDDLAVAGVNDEEYADDRAFLRTAETASGMPFGS